MGIARSNESKEEGEIPLYPKRKEDKTNKNKDTGLEGPLPEDVEGKDEEEKDDLKRGRSSEDEAPQDQEEPKRPRLDPLILSIPRTPSMSGTRSGRKEEFIGLIASVGQFHDS